MLTGADFTEEHTLDDGTVVTLRHIRPDDIDELERAFERLSPSSRYRRFHGPVGALSRNTLRYLTHVDGRDHVAIVALTTRTDAQPSMGIGVGRFVRTKEDPRVAEVALTVADDVQHRGLGRVLAVALARAAYERGVRRFRGQVLADNEPVHRLLDEVGAVIHTSSDGDVVFDVELGDESDLHRHLEVVFRRLLASAAGQIVGCRRHLNAVGKPRDTTLANEQRLAGDHGS